MDERKSDQPEPEPEYDPEDEWEGAIARGVESVVERRRREGTLPPKS